MKPTGDKTQTTPTMKTSTLKSKLAALEAGQYTVILDDNAAAAALKLARGSFQRGIVKGYEALSAMSVKSCKYRGRYVASARNFLARLHEAGIAAAVATGKHGKRVLVLG